jgi:hypothetical protein
MFWRLPQVDRQHAINATFEFAAMTFSGGQTR